MIRSVLVCLVALLGSAGAAIAQAPDPVAVQRGQYLFAVAGCASCHTRVDGQQRGPLGAGGRALQTPFGTFYGPNITSDPDRGIGRWTEADFMRALRDGVRPNGAYYFPAFPYPTFTRITDQDLRDLWAYVHTLPPVAQRSLDHDVGFPFNVRFLQFFWRMLYFTRGPFQPSPGQSAEWNRGAYLAEALGHCQECHTPRNFIGGMRTSMAYAGHRGGPGSGGRDNALIPNITPDRATGIAWSPGELEEFLASGLTPDGDSAGGEMGEVVRESTGRMTPEDRRALVGYLRALPPVENNLRRPGS